MDSSARPWATPEISVDYKSDARPDSISSVAEITEAESQPVVPRPFRMRPLTIPEILDGAFGILRSSPAKVMALVATISAPIDLFLAFLNRDALANGGVFDDFFVIFDNNAAPDGNVFGGGFGSDFALDFVLPQIALVFSAAALARLVAEWFQGRDPTYLEVLSFVGRRAWKIMAVWFLVHLAEAVGLVLLLIPGIIAMVLFLMSIPALITEDLGVIAALRRSRTLAKGIGWRVLGVACASAFIMFGIQLALGILPLLLGSWIGETYGWLVVAVGSLFTSILSLVGTAGITLILYYDTRVRREGLDIAIEANDVFGPFVGARGRPQ